MSRVMLMTFSEFGRRVSENASTGTDHGAAAPMFIIGNKVKVRVLGQHPGLAPGDLFQGDLKYSVDSAPVCRRARNWLQTNSQPILGKKFTPLGIV